MDVSTAVHNLPDGTHATMEDMTLHIGDLTIDLRTLMHDARAFDKLHKYTFPANHARYPSLQLSLSTREQMYVGVLKNANGSYTAMDGKRVIGEYATASEAAIRRALTLRKRRHPTTMWESFILDDIPE
mgnify:CR=1 FL=1